MNVENKAYQAITVKELNEDGSFYGIASVYNVPDWDYDVILKGAFSESIANKSKLPLLWNHSNPVGFVEVSDSEEGILCKGTFVLTSSVGKDAYELVKNGAVDGLSIGFIIEESEILDNKRVIAKATLVEISVVPVLAQPLARITEVKEAVVITQENLLNSVQEKDTNMELQDKFKDLENQVIEVKSLVNDIYTQQKKLVVSSEEKSFAKYFDNDEYNRLLSRKSGHVRLELDTLDVTKKAITSANVGARSEFGGLFAGETEHGKLRQMLTTIPTSQGAVEFVRMSVPSASFVDEGSDPATADATVNLVTLPVRTVSAYQVFSKQILEDNEGLQAAVASVIAYGLENAIEVGLLTGSGTGANLTGFSAVADTATITAGTSKLDCIAFAAQEVTNNRCLPPNFVVLNPSDYFAIRTAKANGVYLLGDPQVGEVSIFGMKPVVTPAMPAGYFLVGNSAPVAAVIRERKGITAEISTEHSDYFAKGLVLIKAEARLALAVMVPNNFFYAAYAAAA